MAHWSIGPAHCRRAGSNKPVTPRGALSGPHGEVGARKRAASTAPSGTLSLIICTCHRPKQVERLLNALNVQTTLQEIVIVDASSGPETEAVVRALDAGRAAAQLHYHRVSSQHRGLTRQRNYGIAHAHGDLIAFLDDDTVPEPDYFEQLLACARRHPDAVGVGGYITGEPEWTSADPLSGTSLSVFRLGSWERREDLRWRVRRVLHLASPLPPGWMPRFGHGRSVTSIPPDGQDHQVEFFMGGACLWRRDLLEREQFSPLFEGYGLYEDLDFCVRAAEFGPLYFCTRARVAHYHAPSGRPSGLRFGQMVVRNGWIVWRRRWPTPPWPDRLRWWAITIVLILCRFGDVIRGPERKAAWSDALGRVWGITTFLCDVLLQRARNSPVVSLHYARRGLDDPAGRSLGQ